MIGLLRIRQLKQADRKERLERAVAGLQRSIEQFLQQRPVPVVAAHGAESERPDLRSIPVRQVPDVLVGAA